MDSADYGYIHFKEEIGTGLIQWNSSLSLGVNEIDEQHMKLIGMISQLHDATMRAGKEKELLGTTLNELVRYTVNHFSTEEKYFDRYDYPETAAHIDEHAKFIREVSAFKKEFEEGRIGITIKLMNFLSEWLWNHIMSSDKKFGPYLNEKGIR